MMLLWVNQGMLYDEFADLCCRYAIDVELSGGEDAFDLLYPAATFGNSGDG